MAQIGPYPAVRLVSKICDARQPKFNLRSVNFRSKVHAILGVRARPPKPTARISTVARTLVQGHDGGHR